MKLACKKKGKSNMAYFLKMNIIIVEGCQTGY